MQFYLHEAHFYKLRLKARAIGIASIQYNSCLANALAAYKDYKANGGTKKIKELEGEIENDYSQREREYCARC